MNEKQKRTNSYDVSPRHKDAVDNARLERRHKDIKMITSGIAVAALTVGGAYLLGKAGFTDPAGPPNPNAHTRSVDNDPSVYQIPEQYNGDVIIQDK